MRKPDKVTLVQAVFCLLVTGAGAGCGDDGKTEARPDAAVERPGDVSADSAKADIAPADLAKADTAPIDGVKTDAPLLLDTGKLDLPATLDVGQGETAIDTAGVDGGPALDGAAVDAPPVADVAVGETSAIDGTGTVDADGMTMAGITFRLQNQGAQAIYVRVSCWVPFQVTSVADGTVYANKSFCACDCADTTCTVPMACAPCAPPSGVAVASGQTKDVSWQARSSTLQSKTGTTGAFECVAHAPIATGAYRLAITVYATEADAVAETNGRVVQHTFALGTTNAVVEVPVP